MSWMHGVAQFPVWWNVLLVFTISALAAWWLVDFVRGRAPYPVFKENNELVGFTYAVYGMIYGVVLAFTIVVSWQDYDQSEAIVVREATILSELWRDSQAFPPEVRDPIHKTLAAYADSVVREEWHDMAQHGRANPHTAAIYEQLWSLSYTLMPQSPNQEAFLGEYLQRMNDLSATRRMRILASHSELNGILWLVLLIGALPTIGYTLLFANRHGWVQVAVAFSMLLIVLLCLLVTVTLQYPFTGENSIPPDAFVELLESFRQRAMGMQ